jgi:hypothetical protein
MESKCADHGLKASPNKMKEYQVGTVSRQAPEHFVLLGLQLSVGRYPEICFQLLITFAAEGLHVGFFGVYPNSEAGGFQCLYRWLEWKV